MTSPKSSRRLVGSRLYSAEPRGEVSTRNLITNLQMTGICRVAATIINVVVARIIRNADEMDQCRVQYRLKVRGVRCESV